MVKLPERRSLQTGAFVVVCTAGWACWWWVQRWPRATDAIRGFRDWDRAQLRLNGQSLTRNLDEVDALDEYGDEDEDGQQGGKDGAKPARRSGWEEVAAMLFPGLYFNKAWAQETKQLRRSASAGKLVKLVGRTSWSHNCVSLFALA